MLTKSKLWQQIESENELLKQRLYSKYTGREISEWYVNSNNFDEFAENFEDKDEALFWWNELNYKHLN